MLDDEFTASEVQDALNDANDVSAPGPSGQNIAFYKLLFADIPNIMTQAINQMVFVPRLNETQQFKWIQHRKVVYIPKKPGPTSPSDYRPLSMLEVLYNHVYWLKDSATSSPHSLARINTASWQTGEYKNHLFWPHTSFRKQTDMTSHCNLSASILRRHLTG